MASLFRIFIKDIIENGEDSIFINSLIVMF